MISTLFAVAVAVALSFASLSSGSAILPTRQEDSDSGILRLPITATHATSRRQVTSNIESIQTGTRYLVDIAIGTPPQPQRLILDSGSSHSWVNPQCSAAGPAINAALCATLPRYSPNASSSALDLQTSMELKYGKGSAQVKFFSDSFDLGGMDPSSRTRIALMRVGALVTGQQFGVATSSHDLPIGLLGIGPGIELTGYPILIDTLKAQGITKSRAFSVDLRSWESADGAIIFGGIDTAKYSGSLEKLPIIPAALAPDFYPRYWVHLKSVGITKPGEVTSKLYAPTSSDPQGQPVYLDTGGTLNLLPAALFNAIIQDFPSARPDGNSGLYLVDCSVSDEAGTVDFGFGNTVINVPFNEFIWHIEGLCYLGMAVENTAPVLGDSFLRAAYVVFDQDNQNIHLANAKNCGTNLVAIGSGPDAVPSIVGACGPQAATGSVSSSMASSTIASSASVMSSSSAISTSASSASITSSNSAFPTISTESIGLYSISNHSSTAEPTAEPTAYPTEYPTEYATSTLQSTSTYTITSCAPTITNCLIGKVTQTVVEYTTVCPASQAAITPAPFQTHAAENPQTVYATETYTISKCGPEVKNCPYGSQTTAVVPVSTSVKPTGYAVVNIGGYRVAPYELVANPAPIAPVVPIQYPVPVLPAPIGVKPGTYQPGAPPAAAPYPISSASTYLTIPTGAPLPSGTGVPVIGAASSMKMGSTWAFAGMTLALLVL
ncbi:uncharacterized protein RAG0_15026 [Rhynchosporium agropyri]|uniref:Peptidase A1 domain-containing protein n=1 Tax=Rhynchosporium agropyri TaxID=914238 RepID=A0A1E1LJC6_9HELO|nr:uncharacterized protein RAG0_15026 [Rhynchosporium agropyri]